VQGRGSDHKICSPHEIIKASVIMDKKDIEKAKLIIHIKYSQLLIEKLKKDEGYVFLSLANHEINLWHTCRPMVDSYLLAIGHSSSKQKKKKNKDLSPISCLPPASFFSCKVPRAAKRGEG
jgi:hypothetical protein